MRRCENCGGTEFRMRANRHIQCDVFFNTSNGKEEYCDCEDIDEPDWYGDCVCLQCGKIYKHWRYVPDDGTVIEHWESPTLQELRKSEK